MGLKTINKSVNINAPKEKVWKVLLDDKYTRTWYNEFSEGTYAETDWTPGSKALFRDKSGMGLIAKITENKPYEVIAMEHQGMITSSGKEDYDSEMAKSVKGAIEKYTLSEDNGTTRLQITCDMEEKYFDSMSNAWERALNKVKELSENG